MLSPGSPEMRRKLIESCANAQLLLGRPGRALGRTEQGSYRLGSYRPGFFRTEAPSPLRLLPHDQREHQRRHDGGVGFDDELGGVDAELAPGDLLVGHGARVAAVAGGGVADLAE